MKTTIPLGTHLHFTNDAEGIVFALRSQDILFGSDGEGYFRVRNGGNESVRPITSLATLFDDEQLKWRALEESDIIEGDNP